VRVNPASRQQTQESRVHIMKGKMVAIRRRGVMGRHGVLREVESALLTQRGDCWVVTLRPVRSSVAVGPGASCNRVDSFGSLLGHIRGILSRQLAGYNQGYRFRRFDAPPRPIVCS
jgi:hypothetical protein